MRTVSVRLQALRIAGTHVGDRETSRNSGPEVDAFLASVGLGPGYPWCAAFVYFCFREAAASVRAPNPCPRTAGALRLWDLCTPQADLTQFVSPDAGSVFVIDHGHGLGHVGFVEELLDDGTLRTIEGNTAPTGTREGDGVYRRSRRISEITRGYLRFG